MHQMSQTNRSDRPADALVLFDATGDLAHKMTFPALYAMVSEAHWPAL